MTRKLESQTRADKKYETEKRVRHSIQIGTDESTSESFISAYEKSECKSKAEFIRLIVDLYRKSLVL